MSEHESICIQRNTVKSLVGRSKLLSYALGLIITLVTLGLTASVVVTGCATQQATKAVGIAVDNRTAIAVSKSQFEEIRRQLNRIEERLEGRDHGSTP